MTEEKVLRIQFLRAFLDVMVYSKRKVLVRFAMFHKDNSEYKPNQVGFYSLDLLVPSDHFLRQVEGEVDFSFIYDVVEDTYSSDMGRPSLDPVLLLKIPLIQCFSGIRSMRQTIKDIEINVAYRWFLELTVPAPKAAGNNNKYTKQAVEQQALEIDCDRGKQAKSH